MLKDRYGLDVSTSSTSARDHYVDGLDRMLAAEGGVETALFSAISADPDFAIAHLALARQHQFFGRKDQAMASAAKAGELAENATTREQRQIEIYTKLFAFDIAEAMKLTAEQMKEYPQDAFALEHATGPFGSLGFSGQADWETQQLEMLAPLAKHYGDDWWFNTVHAFALQETGEWDRGRKMTDRVLSERPSNCHAAHTLAHALFESGDDEDAALFMGDFLPKADRDSLLHCHNSWHHALLLMVTGNQAEAYEFFRNNCLPGSTDSPTINVLTDSVSFLWRAELAGAPRDRELWQTLLDYYDTTFGRPIVYVDAHIGLVHAALGDMDGLDRCIVDLQHAGENGQLPAGLTAAELTGAYKAFAEEDWPTSIKLFEPLMDQVVRVGGSRAQRDMINNTLIAAYVNNDSMQDAAKFISDDHGRQPSRPIAGLDLSQI